MIDCQNQVSAPTLTYAAFFTHDKRASVTYAWQLTAAYRMQTI